MNRVEDVQACLDALAMLKTESDSRSLEDTVAIRLLSEALPRVISAGRAADLGHLIEPTAGENASIEELFPEDRTVVDALRFIQDYIADRSRPVLVREIEAHWNREQPPFGRRTLREAMRFGRLTGRLIARTGPERTTKYRLAGMPAG